MDEFAGNDGYSFRIVVEDEYEFYEKDLFSLKTRNQLMEEGTIIGNTACGEIDIEMNEPDIVFPKMAKIIPEIKGEDGVWKKKGVYYIDTRKLVIGEPKNKLIIYGFDGMLKTSIEIDFTGIEFPADAAAVVTRIANVSGVFIEDGTLTKLDKSLKIPKPEYMTGREILSAIGSMNGGNFCMNDEGKLRFIALTDVLEQKAYILSENRSPIVIGGVRLLV